MQGVQGQPFNQPVHKEPVKRSSSDAMSPPPLPKAPKLDIAQDTKLEKQRTKAEIRTDQARKNTIFIKNIVEEWTNEIKESDEYKGLTEYEKIVYLRAARDNLEQNLFQKCQQFRHTFHA